MAADRTNQGRTEAPDRESARRREQIETGITLRHSRNCGLGDGDGCSCQPGYQAMAWCGRKGKVLRRTFPTLAKARAWRQATQVDLRRGALSAPTARLLREEAEAWLEDARLGIVRNRSGEPYKPSAIRSYEAALANYLLPEFGQLRLSGLDRNRIQALIEKLVRRGLAPSTVCNALLPLRAIYRRALDRELVALNPTERLALPKERRPRQRVPEPRQIDALLRVLPDCQRVLWSAAVHTGLRLGELQALGWQSLDLEAGVLVVERSWDRVAGFIAPKSRAGERTVPIPALLRAELRQQLLRQGHGGLGLVFASKDPGRPFDPSNAKRSAWRIWQRAGLEPLGFHQARHTYAALMIAAGVNAKALSSYMGHSSITVTLDRYGHLFPGNEAEAAARLDRFLAAELEPGLRVLR
jgi:integrase